MAVDDRLVVARLEAVRSQLDRVATFIPTLEDPTRDGNVRGTFEHQLAAITQQCDGAARLADTSAAASAVRRLAEQVLAMAGGLSARAERVDLGMCAIADALLRQVTADGGPTWNMATIPADSDSFGERDHMIRVRWPGNTVWTLPLVLHELGHYVGRRLEDEERLDDERWAIVRPFEERLRETGEEVPADWHHLHELFADAYATYVGGPAYLACCVTLGFDPVDDERDAMSHPRPSRRVRLMLAILDRMNQSGGNSASLFFETEPWRLDWSALTGDIASRTDAASYHAAVTAFLWATLRDRLPNARYRSLRAAKEISGQLADRRLGLRADSGGMTDVLNALWCARHQPGADVATVTERGTELLQRMAARD